MVVSPMVENFCGERGLENEAAAEATYSALDMGKMHRLLDTLEYSGEG